jgi:hypothetical protein
MPELQKPVCVPGVQPAVPAWRTLADLLLPAMRDPQTLAPPLGQD